MSAPNPRFLPGSPVEATEAQVLFASPAVRHRGASSLVRLDTGRLLLAFRLGTGPGRRNDGAIMLTHSDDGGRSWDEPFPLYAYPGWDSLPLGGLVHFSDDLLWLVLGRVIVDESLGGDEPFSQWHILAITSRDGGRSWSAPGPEIRLFPSWTELYGASNPHPLADGRYLLAVMGTMGRDAGWQAGVTFLDLQAGGHFTPPVIIAAAPERNFSDLDLIRLADGRFLAVIREHVTRQSFLAHSANEGRTWSAIRPTGFKGANIKLFRLRSGAVLCAYRDEDPGRRGISCSVSEDGGATWRFVGQLYAADRDVVHRPGVLCGYPDLISLGEREIACVLHTYPDTAGRVQLHFLRLRDRS